MADLISKYAAIMALAFSDDTGDMTCGQMAKVLDVIKAVPTIDPVKHGKWIEYPIADGMNQCSVCGVLRFGDSNYCPNCGADMRGEQKEETDDTEG